MTNNTLRRTWDITGLSVRGASHERSGLPNQDAIAWQSKTPDQEQPIILAVADGHGSHECFRSDRGARLAVNVACELLHEFGEAFRDVANYSVVEKAAEVDLPKQIVNRWQEAVEAELQKQPFTVVDLDTLDPKKRKAVLERPIVAYGATLLAVLLTERFVFYMQLGDGEIVTVSDEGQPDRPLPGDPRLFANETTSLCSPGSTIGRHRPSSGPVGAWGDFRVRLQPLSQATPALILVSTDGYANSFGPMRDNFLKVGSDLLAVIREDGMDYVTGHLEEWLQEATSKGSGDDITLGIIFRKDAVKGVSSPTLMDQGDKDE